MVWVQTLAQEFLHASGAAKKKKKDILLAYIISNNSIIRLTNFCQTSKCKVFNFGDILLFLFDNLPFFFH